MAKTHIIPEATIIHPMCVQYTRTEANKWRVTVHHLQPQPIVSASLLDELPFPAPICPWPQCKPKPKAASTFESKTPKPLPPFRPEDLLAEDTIILMMEEEGYSEEDIAATLRARREHITEQLLNGTNRQSGLTVPTNEEEKP